MSETKGETTSVTPGKRFFFFQFQIDSDTDISSVYFYSDEKITINKKHAHVLFSL